MQWTYDADDEVAHSQIHQLIRSLGLMTESCGLKLDFLFQNDASYIQSPLKSYGAESVAFLDKVTSRYDPWGIFQYLQKSGFLLSKYELLISETEQNRFTQKGVKLANHVCDFTRSCILVLGFILQYLFNISLSI